MRVSVGCSFWKIIKKAALKLHFQGVKMHLIRDALNIVKILSI